MTIAEADGVQLAYIAEVTEGTTPATPAWNVLRLTSESIRAQKQTVSSNEIRSDKNVSDMVDVGRSINGGVEGELSYGSYDDLLESIFRGTWATNVLKNGLDRHSFSFEKKTEEGATDSYIRYRGMFVNTMTIQIQPRTPITLSMGFLGIGADLGASTIVTGATYVAPNDNEVFNSGTQVGTIAVGGIAALPAIKGATVNFSSNLREQLQIGSNDLAGIALGRFEVTGTLDLYFEGYEVYDAIQNHDDATITLPLGSVTGEKYELVLPKVKLLEGDPIAGGNGQDVAFTVAFQAIYDGTTELCTAKLTRAIV